MRLSLEIFRKSYLVGIGGSGVSNLAHLLHSMNCEVKGSDLVRSATTEKLQQKGISICFEQNGDAVSSDLTMMIVTAAVDDSHPEVRKAHELNVPVIKYARALGFLMRFKLGIAIAGTHGKTSTTTLLSEIFQNAGAEPSFLIGGMSKNLGEGGFWGNGRHFIIESCEYDRSFLEFNPHIIGITNIEAEHLDYYRDLHEIEDAFHEFTLKSPESGFIFLNSDNESCANIRRFQRATILTYGITNDADFKAIITGKINGSYTFRIQIEEFLTDEITPALPGIHNVYNSLLSAAIALQLSIDFESIKKSIENFGGSKRRFDFKGLFNETEIYDDYAHHPTELHALIEGAQGRFEDKTVNVLFQPHQAFRTKTFLPEFAQELCKADKVILTSIFAAREKNAQDNIILANTLRDEIAKHNPNVQFIADFDDVVDYLSKNLKASDVLFTVGAGNVYLIGEKLLELENNKNKVA